MTRMTGAAALLALAAAACAPGGGEAKGDSAAVGQVQEATSLLGAPLYRRSFTAQQRAALDSSLAVARAAYERTPGDADSIIWLGRRQAYLEQYQDAIRTFGEGIEKHPEDARLYRFRGHRYLTIREFDKAITDLQRAAELTRGTPDETEPDGAPNARNIPTSTTQGNIYYHLALGHYLKGDYAQALEAWREAMRLARNDDTRVAVSDWLYMTLRRLGRDDEAAKVLASITPGLDIIENTAYYRRLMMYKGELPADSLLNPEGADELQFVTQGYGVANWYLANGDSAKGNEILDKVLATNYWAAFGYIAAEADVARRKAGQ
ncbi:MAG TPA: tetratricopeptide repeat protein [Gemmatimonadaceae bacterium]|nr:tetratricopeptide repeat protein [Gemmatimonadaceae bacterium]